MTAICTDLSAARAEDVRRQLAAMLFFNMPPNGAVEAEKIKAWQRVMRGLLFAIDMLEGSAESDDFVVCEGCGKRLDAEAPRLNCEDCYLCAECAPDEHPATDFGYRACDADRDIEQARIFGKALADV